MVVVIGIASRNIYWAARRKGKRRQKKDREIMDADATCSAASALYTESREMNGKRISTL